jgi:isovaleryl-CoA dehydrogenase
MMSESRYDALFNPTPEHQMIRETIAEFAVKHVDPQAAAHDEKGELNLELFRQLGELGVLGITIPEEAGGAGMASSTAATTSSGSA